MEVHAHSHTDLAHGGTSRKKFKHYLFEFFMLFLAVFCGFLAENEREHLVEHQRERQYMKSLAEDLNTDIIQYTRLEPPLESLIARLDSIIEDIDYSQEGYPSLKTFKQLSLSIGFPDYIYTDRTMQQLKNAGGMRLIRNLNVADSIVKYDVWVRRGLAHQELLNSLYMPRLIDKINSTLNVSALSKLTKYTNADTTSLKKTILLTRDKSELIILNNEVRTYKIAVDILLGYIRLNKKIGIDLLSLIKKEYNFK